MIDKAYHLIGDKTKPYVSSSSMSKIMPDEGGSPQSYLAFFDPELREKAEEKRRTSLERGSLFHLWCEDQEQYMIEPVLPEGKIGREWAYNVYENLVKLYEGDFTQADEAMVEGVILDTRTEYGYYSNYVKREAILKAFDKESKEMLLFLIKKEGRLAITISDHATVEKCIESVKKHPIANNVVRGPAGLSEHYVLWSELIDVAGHPLEIQCKAMIDKMFLGNNSVKVWDIKTTGFSKYQFIKSFVKFRYYRQMAWYRRAIIRALQGRALVFNPAGEQIDFPIISDVKAVDMPFNILIQETGFNNLTGVTEVSKAWLSYGLMQCTNVLQRIAYHTINNQWELSYEEVLNDGKIIMPEPYDYLVNERLDLLENAT